MLLLLEEFLGLGLQGLLLLTLRQPTAAAFLVELRELRVEIVLTTVQLADLGLQVTGDLAGSLQQLLAGTRLTTVLGQRRLINRLAPRGCRSRLVASRPTGDR